MNLRVVFLENGGRYAFKILLRPIDQEASRDGVHEAFVAFKDFQWSRNTSHCQKRRKRASGGGVRVRQPLPVREFARASDPQGIESRAADADGVGGLHVIERERFRNSRCHGVGPLRRVVETCGPHRSHIAEAALHLVADRESGQEVTTGTVRVFDRGKHRSQIVARMTGLSLTEIAVIEVQVAD